MHGAAIRALVAAAAAALAATAAAFAPGDDRSSTWIRVAQQPTGGSMAGTGERIEIHSFHWGPRQSTSADGSRGRAGNQMIMDDTAGSEKAAVGANETLTVGSGRTESDPDRPVIAGSVPNASAGKRQHGAVTITKEWGAATPQLAKPQATGSVWVRMATPWPACRVGARYPSVELGGGGKSYALRDVTVAACAAHGVTLDYAKVTVRGWNPESKQH